jgi:HEAT repeat protein
LQLHKNAAMTDAVAQWIEPFLHGNASLSAEMAVAEAKAHGLIQNRAQVVADCRAALMKVRHPMHRSRLLRLIADLSLVQLEVDILPLLHAITADERSASVRALGRLGIKSAEEAVRSLLDDPVQEVRKAAQASLHNLNEKEPRVQHATPIIAADGTRSWIVAKEQQTQQIADEDTGWKSRLRSIIDA